MLKIWFPVTKILQYLYFSSIKYDIFLIYISPNNSVSTLIHCLRHINTFFRVLGQQMGIFFYLCEMCKYYYLFESPMSCLESLLYFRYSSQNHSSVNYSWVWINGIWACGIVKCLQKLFVSRKTYFLMQAELMKQKLLLIV